MNRWSRRAFLVLLVAILTAAPLDAQARSFLWKVTNGKGTVYLAGSVHMLSEAYYPLSPALEAAFESADLLVEELDFGDMAAPDAQMLMLTRGLLPGGQTLDSVLSRSTLDLVGARVGALGLPFGPLKRFKPWALALTVLSMEWRKAGFDAELGLDKHFYDRARMRGKAVQGLETVAFQISRFDGLSMPDQDRLLVQSMRELDTETTEIMTLAAAWKAGDADTIERILLRDMKADRTLYQRLIVERNLTWLPTIEALFARPAPAFVVVGAAHLVGPDGLLAALRAKGYALEQQ